MKDDDPIEAEMMEWRNRVAELMTALRQIHDLTYPYADGAVDADAHSKLCARISDITRDFIKP